MSTRPHARRPHTLAPGEPTRHAPGLLNRAEWLKFGAAFFNKEAEANHVFDGIRSRFTEIVDHVLAARLAGASSPRSAFISHSPESTWDGTTYPETFVIDNTAYKNEVIFKAGGKTVDHTTAAALCPLNYLGNKYSCPNAAALKEVRTFHRDDCYRLVHGTLTH